VDLDFAGEDDLLQLTARDQLDRTGDGLLVVLGWHGACDLEASGGRWVEEWQRAFVQLPHARVEPRE
jgi:hypothetical protein